MRGELHKSAKRVIKTDSVTLDAYLLVAVVLHEATIGGR